ncbi:MAG: response regulator [Phycisphaerales bacterium]|nr:response regulator [Phycisphaerales bacterium]
MAMLAIVLIVIPLFAGRAAINRLDAQRQSAIDDAIEASHERVRAAMSLQLGELGRTLEDWSAWDDMYGFASDPTDDKWRRQNFAPDGIASLGLSRAGLYDVNGQPILRTDYDHEAGEATEFPINDGSSGLVVGLGPDTDLSISHGGLCTGPDGRPSWGVVRPIRRTDKSGPHAGFLLMVRPITGGIVEQIGGITGTSITISPERNGLANSASPDDDGSCASSLELTSWDGRHVAWLTVRTPVTTVLAQDESLRSLILRVSVLGYVLLACASLVAVSASWPRQAGSPALPGLGRMTGRVPVSLAAGIGLALTGLASWTVRVWQEDIHAREFARRSGTYGTQVERAIGKRSDAILYVRSHYHSSGDVGPDEFERLIQNANLMYPGTRQWAWVPLPAETRSSGTDGPATQKEESRLFVVPSAGATGFASFMAAWPVLSDAMESARDSGRLVAVTLPRTAAVSPNSRTIALVAPVYQRAVETLMEHRRRDFRGALVSIIELDPVLADAVKDLDFGGLAAGIAGVSSRPILPAPIDDDSDGQLTRRCSVRITDELSLDLEIFATRRFKIGLETAVITGVAAAGTVLTCLLCAFIELNLQRTRRVEHLVAVRTGELEEKTRELLAASVAAQDAHRTKSAFLANMSHELRTPMTAILGYSDLLFETHHTPEARQEFIRTIRRSGEHLLTLINDVLDLSKIEAGRLTIERLPCETSALIADVVSLLRDKASQKGIRLGVEFAGPIPVSITTDPTRFRQVLMNLVGNAIKFTETGGVRVITRLLGNPSESDPLMSIEVVDSGPGIDAEVMQRLFKPFEQGDGSMSRKFGGTGLGLSISRQLSEMLGGTVAASSIPGEGSCFLFTLRTGSLEGVELRSFPAYTAGERGPTAVEGTAPTSCASGATTPVAAVTDADSASRDARILLAEDTIDNQRLLCLNLKKLGCDVMVVANGQQAVAEAITARGDGRPFDVILMDMQMPVMDGYAATRALREAQYRLPIIALTAHASPADRQRCLQAGCDSFLSKPVNRAELLRICREFIQQAREILAAA